jgi:hypothetical protein
MPSLTEAILAGRSNSHIAALVERNSRCTILVHVAGNRDRLLACASVRFKVPLTQPIPC